MPKVFPIYFVSFFQYIYKIEKWNGNITFTMSVYHLVIWSWTSLPY